MKRRPRNRLLSAAAQFGVGSGATVALLAALDRISFESAMIASLALALMAKAAMLFRRAN